MKKLLTTSLLALCFLTRNTAQNVSFPCAADTLQPLQWEFLSGPPAKVNAYAQCRERVFAATDLGLFYHDNPAAAWTLQPQTRGFKIDKLFANDSVVLFQYKRTLAVAPHTGVTTQEIEVYRSLDMGQHFETIYTLDGDGEYFGTVVYPYVITPFTEVGAGFIYFEHGLPYAGFGASDPFEYSRYFSPDYGKNWYQAYVTYTGFFPPFSKVFQELSVCRDTLLGIQFRVDNLGQQQHQLNLYPGLAFQGAALTDSLQNFSQFQSFKHAVYYQGALYLVRTGFQSFKSSVARFPGVLSGAFGDQFSVDSLYFTDEPNHQPEKCWNTDTLLWFEFANGHVYRSSLAHPAELSFQYQKIKAPAFAKTFAVLPSGWYANNLRYETLFSDDAGLNWQKSDEGLSTDLFGLGYDHCGQIIASPHPVDYPSPYKYFHHLPDERWAYVDSTQEKSLYRKIGVALGKLFMSTDSKVLYTSDCAAPASWAPLVGLPTANWGDTIMEADSRAYYFSRNCMGCKVYVSDDGVHWQDAGFYGLGNLSVKGDTLVSWRTNSARISSDGGLNWVDFYFPGDFHFSWVVVEKGRFFALNQSDSGLQWFVCEDIIHADALSNWAPSGCYIDRKEQAYAAFGDALIPASLAGHSGGMLFLHAAGGLYVSNDEAQTWYRLPALPFKNEFSIPQSNTGQLQYGESEGAAQYLALGGYLYAFSKTQGVWRADLKSLTAQLPPPLVQTFQPEIPAGALRLYPNPAGVSVQVELPAGFVADKLVILNTLMQAIAARPWTNNGLLSLQGLRAGVYVIGVFDGNGRAVFGKLYVN